MWLALDMNCRVSKSQMSFHDPGTLFTRIPDLSLSQPRCSQGRHRSRRRASHDQVLDARRSGGRKDKAHEKARNMRANKRIQSSPYDSRPAEIRELHERYRYNINEASSTVADLELRQRNVKEFTSQCQIPLSPTSTNILHHKTLARLSSNSHCCQPRILPNDQNVISTPNRISPPCARYRPRSPSRSELQRSQVRS